MELGDLLTPDAVVPALKASNKKQALQALSEQAAKLAGLQSRDVYEALQQRELLGSTGVGRGIAIPHGRLPALQKIFSGFARLEHPIDFEAPDEEPVDLVFLLLAPEHAGADHLKALARISRLLREPQSLEKLRTAPDRAALFALLTEPNAVEAA
jgi:PTS system nitrogen regulatory IIA component